jgi:transcriptional regulator with XRE-family HTH domain
VHTNETDLGAIVKAARLKKGLTQEKLAEKVGVGLRHIMAIENEGSYPSYEVLYEMIRELHIPADTIFYPEKLSQDASADEIVRMLYGCDERSLKIIRATVQAALNSQAQDN